MRFSRVIVFALCLLVPVCSFAEKSPPKLSIRNPHYDFGQVKQGDVVKHDFVIHNSGGADLHLHRIIPGCGCTATSATRKKIPPGGDSTISVQYNTSGFLGKKVRTVTVETDDPKSPLGMLTLAGTIEADIVIEPRAISFGEVKQGTQSRKEFSIAKAADSKTVVKSVSTRVSSLRIEKLKDQDLKTIYTVSVNKDAPIGGIRGLINISLADKNNTTLTIPVFASITK